MYILSAGSDLLPDDLDFVLTWGVKFKILIFAAKRTLIMNRLYTLAMIYLYH